MTKIFKTPLSFFLCRSTSENLNLWNNQVAEAHFQISCPPGHRDSYKTDVETLYLLEVQVIQVRKKQIIVLYIFLLNICPKEDEQSFSMFASGHWRWIKWDGQMSQWMMVLSAKSGSMSSIPRREPAPTSCLLTPTCVLWHLPVPSNK